MPGTVVVVLIVVLTRPSFDLDRVRIDRIRRVEQEGDFVSHDFQHEHVTERRNFRGKFVEFDQCVVLLYNRNHKTYYTYVHCVIYLRYYASALHLICRVEGIKILTVLNEI